MVEARFSWYSQENKQKTNHKTKNFVISQYLIQKDRCTQQDPTFLATCTSARQMITLKIKVDAGRTKISFREDKDTDG